MKLSVIVCTRNRAHAILPCLNSIAHSLAHAAPIDAEIVVVDNASTDNTSALLQEWAKSCAFPVNLQFEPRKGAALARNCGLRAAQGDLLAWTDDDCQLSENHITELLRHDAADTELVLRGGRVELGDPGDLRMSIRTSQTLFRWQKDKYPAAVGYPTHVIIGANMSMRRALVDKLGFFDERFGPGSKLGGGEETDYIVRAYFAGILIEYVPDMVVYHHHGRKLSSEGYRLMGNYMTATGGLYAKYLFKHPGLCRPFYWDVKNAVREILSGTNMLIPEYGFSHKSKVVYSLLGAAKYVSLSLKGVKSETPVTAIKA